MKSIHRYCLSLVCGISLTVASCSTGDRSPSGFLSNFSQMDAGYGTTNAVSAYLKSGVDLKKYDSVMIDPVTTVIAASGVSPEVTAQLAANLEDALRSQATVNLKLVTTPGPSTLRVRAALTDVIEGGRGRNAVTTVHTNPRATQVGKLGSPELASFISNICFEMEVLDSLSGERIGALSDHRIGAKRNATASSTWAGVRSATNQGIARMWKRFMDARGS